MSRKKTVKKDRVHEATMREIDRLMVEDFLRSLEKPVRLSDIFNDMKVINE